MELLSLAALGLAALLAAPQSPPSAGGGAAPPAMRTAPTRGTMKLELPEHTVSAQVAKPQGEGTWPGVVLLHDSMGLTPAMQNLARRLSSEGFVVYAPDLYDGKHALDADKGRELSVLMDEREAIARIDAVANHLRFLKEVGDHRVGFVGFDLGGRLALMSAMGSQDVSAVVVAYGTLAADDASLRRITCPVLGLFGAQDSVVPPAAAESLRAALAGAGRTVEWRMFDGAGHHFMKEGDPLYAADAAAQAWSRMISFLKEML